MKRLINKFTASFLFLQFLFAPILALAQVQGTQEESTLKFKTGQVLIDEVFQKTEKRVSDFEKSGWVFYSLEKEQLSTLSSILKGAKGREILAQSPYIEELNASFHLKYSILGYDIAKKTFSYRIAIMDSEFTKVITGRKFEISMDPKKLEESKLLLTATLHSLADEMVQKRSLLGWQSSLPSAQKIVKMFASLLIPEAQADNVVLHPKKHENTVKILSQISTTLTGLGFLIVIGGFGLGLAKFSTRKVEYDSLGKELESNLRITPAGWATIACFAVATLSYLGAGMVADLD